MLPRKLALQALATLGGGTKMWLSAIDHGLQWYDRLQIFSQGDPFERFVPQRVKTSGLETAAAICMVVSIIGSAAAIFAKILL
ncbi:hypothetical protein J1C56_02560 [Aminobacter anthyllidis]|uniref:Uncharacterized protein n=1 Tax=Aminobacter anthyllidis TaxID=1035067 RepID=A0A9X1A7G0_9HYPH|nr:hypothetical protein [Aminobacter anthyllidis]MBT1154466.1 hypothetical protein [Aminobacter anthyllidis]